MRIEAVQGEGYGKYEFDLLGTDGYVGLVIGTETRNGIIWEVQRWRNGNPDGSIMRLSAMSFEAMMVNADRFTGR